MPLEKKIINIANDLKPKHISYHPWVGVFGLGYVGAVTGACLASSGFKVIGTDPNSKKRECINQGRAPIVEPGLDEMISQTTKYGMFKTMADPCKVVCLTDMSIVCVGTPSDDNGDCDLTYLKQVCRDIGKGIKERIGYHVVVFRSTIPPNSTRKILIPILEESSGKTCGIDFGVCFHPELLREGTAIDDFYAPPKTVIGAFDKLSTTPLDNIYSQLNLETIRTSIEVAEMVKYADNSWHAVKISFANEIGRLSQALKIDSHDVMDIFVQDTKLNISPCYMIPGAAFGGSCLPKDLRGITHLAKSNAIDLPVLSSVLDSNQAQINHTVELIKKSSDENGTICFLGVTFKPDTDDLRESPVLRIMAILHSQGYNIQYFDPNLTSNGPIKHELEHIKHEAPAFKAFVQHVADLKSMTAERAMAGADIIVVSHNTDEFRDMVRQREAGQYVIDLVRLFNNSDAWPAVSTSGVDDYVTKPISKQLLMDVISKWTERNQNPRVLIAEDEKSTALVTQLMLEKAGCEVHQVSNGLEAVEAARDDNYDIILMDLNMPVKNGIEATKQIRELPGNKSKVPILACSSYTGPEKSTTYSGICW